MVDVSLSLIGRGENDVSLSLIGQGENDYSILSQFGEKLEYPPFLWHVLCTDDSDSKKKTKVVFL